jgi:molecular chaperone GrpE (heat shock protein)
MKTKAAAAGVKPQAEAAQSGPARAGGAIADVNASLRSTRGRLFELKAAAERIEAECLAAQGQCALVWREQEELAARYYSTLRDVLGVLDLCQQVQGASPQAAAIAERLQQVLRAQGIAPMAVKPGDRFDAERHECAETAERKEQADGVILDVICNGFTQHVDGRAAVVIRPASVIVNRRANTSKKERR